MHMHFYSYVIGGNAYFLDQGKEWCHSGIYDTFSFTESLWWQQRFQTQRVAYDVLLVATLTMVINTCAVPCRIVCFSCSGKYMYNVYVWSQVGERVIRSAALVVDLCWTYSAPYEVSFKCKRLHYKCGEVWNKCAPPPIWCNIVMNHLVTPWFW